MIGTMYQSQPVTGDAGQHRLYILRQNHAPAIDECPGASDGNQCEGSTRTQSMDEHRAVARGFDQQLNVVEKGW